MNSAEIAKAIFHLFYSMSNGEVNTLYPNCRYELVSNFPKFEIAFSYRLKDATDVNAIQIELSKLGINITFVQADKEPTYLLVYLP